MLTNIQMKILISPEPSIVSYELYFSYMNSKFSNQCESDWNGMQNPVPPLV